MIEGELGNRRACLEAARQAPNPAARRMLQPVSYTHLDVYKRQTLHMGISTSTSAKVQPKE